MEAGTPSVRAALARVCRQLAADAVRAGEVEAAVVLLRRAAELERTLDHAPFDTL